MVEIALRADIKVNKAEHTAEMIGRVHAAFLQAQLTNPLVCFTMIDAAAMKTSSVERVLKRFPDLKRFDYSAHPWAKAKMQRQIGNDFRSPASGEPVDLATLLQIVSGIPKAYPFSTAAVRLTHPLFGAEPHPDTPQYFSPGVTIENCWALSKRNVSLTTLVIMDADPRRHDLPGPAQPLAAVLEACGRPTLTRQIVLPGQRTAVVQKVAAIAKDTEARLGEVVQRARLPHDFSEQDDHPPRQPIGPRKPALVTAFRPLGYDCRREGMMVLVCRRRTASNLTVKLHLDFGSWGSLIHPTYSVHGLGFSAAIRLPVSPGFVSYNLHWLVDPLRWQQIVDNLAVLVAELDQSFVPAIDAAAGPNPLWYYPDT